MRTPLIATALSVAFLAAPVTSTASEQAREYRALSDQGKAVVASRVYKGRDIVNQMIERVGSVDLGYRQHIHFYRDMKSCKATDQNITTLTPDSRIDSAYTLKPSRKDKGKGAPDSCEFSMTIVSDATDWKVTCDLSMKEANTISGEAIASFSDAIERFRNDGLYSNVSPSATLTKLQQSDSCRMTIIASNFE